MNFIRYLFNLLSRFNFWMFSRGARGIEVLNTLGLILFSFTFILDALDSYMHLYELPSYQGFATAFPFWIWLVMFGVGILQLLAMCKISIRSDKASGLILLFSAAIWAFISGTFYYSVSGVVTTAFFIYLSLAFVVANAGWYQLNISKQIEDIVNAGSK